MSKELLTEIDARIRVCLDAEGKLEYVDSLLRKKKIGKLEHNVLKQNILKNKPEHLVRSEINDYVSRAVDLKNKFKSEYRLNSIKIFSLFAILILSIFIVGQFSVLTGLFTFNSTLQNQALIKDGKGNSISADIDVTDLQHGTSKKIKSEKQTISKGKYKIKVTPQNHAIKSIVFEDMESSSNITEIVQLDQVRNKNNFKRIYAINPLQLNFLQANITITASQGKKLYKCGAWNFNTQTCDGNWVLFKDNLIPGREYSFILTPEDPAFGEIIEISSAEHLDSGRNFISDIYPQVYQLDGVWSEPIYENEFVRVTFEKKLHSFNDITIYPRNVQQLNTRVEVYLPDTNTKIAEFPIITTAKYYRVILMGLSTPTDTFDLKIVNNDLAQAYLEFDHIIDPSTTSVVITSTSGSTSQALNADNITITTITNDASTVNNVTDWRNYTGGTAISYAVLNFAFENNTNSQSQTTDYSTNANLGTVQADLNFVKKGSVGRMGGYYNWSGSHDGTNDKISFTGITSGTTFTIVQWIRPISWASDFQMMMAASAQNPGGAYYDGNTDRIGYYKSGAFYSTGTVTANAWNHVVWRVSAGKLEYFINGVKDASSTTGVPSISFDNIGHSTGGAVYEGGIDSVMMFLTNLSDEQIKDMYNAGRWNILNAKETNLNEKWGVRICPSDSISVGTCKNSNNLTIVDASLTNSAPVISNLRINSTHGTNFTNENLTAYWTATDSENEKIINVTDWRVNGRSIALLNMPFERNLTYNATDYSTYKKHANTVFQAAWKNVCKRTNTGCYKFDGTNDHINISDSVMPSINMTISFFLNATDITAQDGLITKWLNGTSASWAVEQNGTLRMYVSDGTAAYTANYAQTGKVFNANKWYHVAVIFNGSASAANKVLFYVDGKQKAGNVVGTIPSVLQDSTSMMTIGGYSGNLGRFAAAWIDDIKIYNRTLSLYQIQYLNLSRNDRISFEELLAGQNWSVAMTPIDLNGTGTTKLSNNITIRPFVLMITNIQTRFTNQSAGINWTTNIASNTTLRYGTTKSLGTKRHLQNSVTFHNVSLTQLTSNTRYFYNVSSCYLTDCTTQGTFNFTTRLNSFIFINSTRGRNLTTENLTVYSYLSSAAKVINITDWRRNGTSIANFSYWFEPNGTKNATDYSTYKRHITSINGAPAYHKSGGLRQSGAYFFDGSNDWMGLPGNENDYFTTKAFTIEAWVNLTALPGAGSGDIVIAKYFNSGSIIVPWAMWITNNLLNANYGLTCGEYDGSWKTAGSTSSGDQITTGKWTHLVCTFSGGTGVWKAYKNGKLMGTSSASALADNDDLPEIGSGKEFGTQTYFTNGYIDNVAYYNRNLSLEQILIHNATGKRDTISSDETKIGDIWGACVTPNNMTGDEARRCSNNITIRPRSVNVTRIYPNQTGVSEGITLKNNISITRNFSRTNNLTFNATVNKDYAVLTFRWFVNQVLKFTNVVTSGFTSTFKWLFNTTGQFNITLRVNGTDSYINDTFTWKLTTSANVLPLVNNVILNSTHRTNLTTDNLTVYWNSTDINNQKIVNITDWRVNSKSIALLNMPFERNGTTNATDYSTFRNIATIFGAQWIPNGRGSGAYNFTGDGGNISFTSSGSLKPRDNFTISHWVYMRANVGETYPTFISSVESGPSWNWVSGAECSVCGGNADKYYFYSDDLTPTTYHSATAIPFNSWHHLATVYNEGSSVDIYLDGALSLSTPITSGTISYANPYFTIGADHATCVNPSNNCPLTGMMDDAMIFNRSLSSQQIRALYRNRTDLIVSQETIKNQNWTACIIPNDGYGDGSRVCSNNVTIRNKIDIMRIFPNQTGVSEGITLKNNISLTRNFSRTNNLTFNATITADAATFTFKWFVNLVLKYTEVVTSGFTSTFKWLFNTTGQFNVTLKVNGTEAGINDSFNWRLTTKNFKPLVNNVILNSTHRTNYTTDNLTVYWNSTDINNQKIINITDWRVNGKSRAIRHWEFERNGTYNATDYSTSKSHIVAYTGTPIWNATGGYARTGAYMYNGKSSSLNAPSITLNDNFSVSFWAYARSIASAQGERMVLDRTVSDTNSLIDARMIASPGSINQSGFAFRIRSWTGVGGLGEAPCSAAGHVANKWFFETLVRDSKNPSNRRLLQYSDGVLCANVSTTVSGTITLSPKIGMHQSNANQWNGSIDDLRFWNGTLSPKQILALYKNRTDLIVSQETIKNQNWTACITPNDGVTNGLTKCSNNVTIRNSIPTTPIQIAPNNGNDTNTNLTVYFNWTTSTDADNDAITYFINLTSHYCAQQVFGPIVGHNYTSQELTTVNTCGYYNWTVRAYDGTSYSPYSSIFNFTIQPYVAITLLQNLTDFGFLRNGQTNDTSDNKPGPFIVRSDSNVLVNLTVNATDPLWDTDALGSNKFMFKVNTTNEPNSFNSTNSRMVYTPLTGFVTSAVHKLKYTALNDTVGIDFNITVPATETPGMKKSNIIVRATQS